MGRHATASSRSAQKWQVAGNRNSETSSDVVRAATDRPCEEKVGGSTPTSSPTCATVVDKNEDRERWADIDVESDGEQVIFDSKYGDDAQDHKGDGWATSGKKAGRLRPKARSERAVKPDPPAPPAAARTTRDTFASSRQASTKQAEVAPAPVPYRPPKADVRKTASQDHHYESSSHWEASSWGTSGSGWKSSSKAKDSYWDSGTWDQKDTHRSSDSRKHRGGKEKNESFKRGPTVATNMDASRLAW